jgi:hypothetical protein
MGPFVITFPLCLPFNSNRTCIWGKSLLLWNPHAPNDPYQSPRSFKRRLEIPGRYPQSQSPHSPHCDFFSLIEAEIRSRLTWKLQGFVRHHVRSVDYPAIIPSLESGKLLGRRVASPFNPSSSYTDLHVSKTRDLEADEACVRGTYVSGLTKVDVLALDAFEGDVSPFPFSKHAPSLRSPAERPFGSVRQEYARLLIKTTSSNPYLLTPLFSPPLLTPDANETPMLPTPLSSPYFQNVPVKPSILTLSTSCTLGQLKRVQGLKRVEMKVGEVQERAEKAEEGFAQVEGWVYVWREEVGRLEKKIWE